MALSKSKLATKSAKTTKAAPKKGFAPPFQSKNAVKLSPFKGKTKCE